MRRKVRVLEHIRPLGFPVKDALFPEAAMVKCHKQGGLKRRTVLSQFWRLQV